MHKRTTEIGIVLLVLIATTILALAVVADADAARNPAPSSIVAAAHRPLPPRRGTTGRRAWAICHVFGSRRCRAALNVAWCESGLRTTARNGQYRGIFQMGSSERARFGHGSSTWAQARAAFRYHSLVGWRAWECRP